MRIAVLSPFEDSLDNTLENYFHLHALRLLLPETEWVPWWAGTPEADWVIALGNRVLADGPWDEWLARNPSQVLALGLRLDEGRTISAAAAQKLGAIARAGGVTVLDPLSRQVLAKLNPAIDAPVAASSVLFCAQRPVSDARGGVVFCPATSDPAFMGAAAAQLRRLCRRYYRRLNRQGRALFMAHSVAELELGALPGMNALFEPRAPHAHLKAIASAGAVVGAHPTALFAAVASGVPAVYVGTDRSAKSAVEVAGIPFLEINPNTDPAELEHRVAECVRKYPWETIREKCTRLKGPLQERLAKLGIRSAKRQAEGISTGQTRGVQADPLHVATQVSAHQVSSFVGLFENLRELVARELHFHVLALDRESNAALQALFPNKGVYLYSAEDVWQGTDQTVRITPVLRRRRILQPHFLSVLVKQCGAEVVYTEPDLFFYSSPERLLEKDPSIHTVLVPHWTGAWEANEGLVNPNLMAVGPGSQAWLGWWADTAAAALCQRPMGAVESSPSYLGLAPVLFPGIAYYRLADQAVGEADLDLLGGVEPALHGEPPRMSNGQPLASLGVGLTHGRWGAPKGSWDQVCHFFYAVGAVSARHPLLVSVLRRQSEHWPDLGRFISMSEALGRHLPWLAHPTTRAELRWLVTGQGRHLVRGLNAIASVWLGKGPTPTGPRPGTWARPLARAVLFPLPSASAPQPAPLAEVG